MIRTNSAAVLVVSVLLTLAGCASTAGKDSDSGDTKDSADAVAVPSGGIIYTPPIVSDSEEPQLESPATVAEIAESPMKTKLTLSVPAGTAGDAVRAIGEIHGGNLVLMAGAEGRTIPALEFKRDRLGVAATTIASSAGLAAQETSDYYFLFPPGYEPLVEVTLAGTIPPSFGPVKTDVTFGYGLRLFTVFAWMGYAFDKTIVADNSIADARCGELALGQVPFDAALEAILKSARVNSFRVDCTEEYVFLYNPGNTNPREAILNTNPLEESQRQMLERSVTLILPHAPTAGKPLEMQQSRSNLSEVLDSISQQLGVTVVAENGLENLPVNPAVMTDVRLGTALDLLIRQWLVPDYGYQVTRDRIVIRTRQHQTVAPSS